MKRLRITTEPTAIDVAIDQALTQLNGVSPETDEYTKIVDQVARLTKLKEKPSHSRVSADTMAIVAGNLAGIALILGYERAHVVTTKALGFVMKPR